MLARNKGFTLIELLVVIAIIGILSSVVLASLNSARQKSRDARRISDINQIQLAMELYFDSCGQYPDEGATALDLPVAGENSSPTGTCGSTWSDFMTNNPTPPGGVTLIRYVYDVTGTGNTNYCLGAELEDTAHPNAQTECTIAGVTTHHRVAP